MLKLLAIISFVFSLVNCGPQAEQTPVNTVRDLDETNAREGVLSNEDQPNNNEEETAALEESTEEGESADATAEAMPDGMGAVEEQIDEVDAEAQAALALVAQGNELYTALCNDCHGANGIDDDKRVSGKDLAKLVDGFEKKDDDHEGVVVDANGLAAIAAAATAGDADGKDKKGKK